MIEGDTGDRREIPERDTEERHRRETQERDTGKRHRKEIQKRDTGEIYRREIMSVSSVHVLSERDHVYVECVGERCISSAVEVDVGHLL